MRPAGRSTTGARLKGAGRFPVECLPVRDRLDSRRTGFGQDPPDVVQRRASRFGAPLLRFSKQCVHLLVG